MKISVGRFRHSANRLAAVLSTRDFEIDSIDHSGKNPTQLAAMCSAPAGWPSTFRRNRRSSSTSRLAVRPRQAGVYVTRSMRRPTLWSGAIPTSRYARTFPLSMSPLAQSGIEQMREPDTCFLQLLADDRGVRHDIGGIDRHFPRCLVTGRALSNAVFRLRLFRDGEGFVCMTANAMPPSATQPPPRMPRATGSTRRAPGRVQCH
jgi:hypothetical protein